MCDNVLNLVSTTIPHMESVLWPYLMEFIVPAKYMGAQAVVAKSLTYLARKKREANDPAYAIKFDVKVNVPKPHSIIARYLVLACQPHERGTGPQVLACLQAIGPALHETLAAMVRGASLDGARVVAR